MSHELLVVVDGASIAIPLTPGSFLQSARLLKCSVGAMHGETSAGGVRGIV
jgi:hypothetical protein